MLEPRPKPKSETNSTHGKQGYMYHMSSLLLAALSSRVAFIARRREAMAHDASPLEQMPDHIIVHVLSFSMRAHPRTKALTMPTLRLLVEGEELPRIRHVQYVNGKLVGPPAPATTEEVRLEHARVNRVNEVFLRFNKDERFDNGYYEPTTTRSACITPAQHFRNALCCKWEAVMSFSRTSRQNRSLARDAKLWQGFEKDLQSAFPLVAPPQSDVQSVVQQLMADQQNGGAQEVAAWLDPRIAMAQPALTDPFARTAALAAYIARVLVRMEAVVDEMLALENGGFHTYFSQHLIRALNAQAAGLDPDQTIGDIGEMMRLYLSDSGRAHLRHAILFHLVYDIFRKKGCLASQRNIFGYVYYPIMKVCAGGPLVARGVVDMPGGADVDMVGHRDLIVGTVLNRIDCFS
jgi:hypothetical protein